MNNKTNKLIPEIIEIEPVNDADTRRWNPNIGAETEGLLNSSEIDENSKKIMLYEATQILSKCISPLSVNKTNTGLVVGYVQSGKTMSFITIASLARDNNYPLIIIIAGTSIPLFEQTVSRLRKDLRLDTRVDTKWRLFLNPKNTDSNIISIKNTLQDWKDKTVPEDQRQTVLITVMKHHTHLNNLRNIFNELEIDWKTVPVLIIDDEADQASLNTLVNKDEESTTYKCLTGLRKLLVNNTLLQYTATPQGPLLINIINILSPDYAEVLTPGESYVGGKDIFVENSKYVKLIRVEEILSEQEPPESLKEAMAIYFVGVAIKHLLQIPDKNRSMLVHPSIKRIKHNQFFVWVNNIKNNWETILELPDHDSDKVELLEEFRRAYLDLAYTIENLPSFDEISNNLRWIIRKTIVEEVNSARGSTPIIDWSTSPSYILVGGQAMDRGFTVKGLTVTYMPRGVGVGNADTIEQRARFFGYKRNYLGYCRVFLDQDTMEAYRDYVIHEEDIRKLLIRHGNTGKLLSELKRVFLMPKQLRPTRKNILDIEYLQDNILDSWYYSKSPHSNHIAIEKNRKIIDQFVSSNRFEPDLGHQDRSLTMRHLVNQNLNLKDIYENILTQFIVNEPGDSRNFIGLLLQVKYYLESYPNETCSVFLMSCSNLKDGWIERVRSLDNNDGILNLFQGAHPDSNKIGFITGEIYPGDMNIGDKTRLIIQVHKLKLLKDERDVCNNIYNIAIWVPEKMSNPWLSQLNKNHSYD